MRSETETQRHTAASVRDDFLKFFEARGHTIVPSAPVFPRDDPTLLFTNAGMNQFKDVFLGTGTREYKRAVDTQKCIRVSGKHNDLEEVGVDTYHHTFFEMLGNWSFGDYFKEEAIPWAWELLTEVWGLPRERLWVTIFAGDETDGLPPDLDSERIWIRKAGIASDRVLRFGRKDNFWEMGDTGPCGPCTEIHIDRGGPGTNPMDGREKKIGVNAGNERFIELWNNVFMEFNRLDDGSLRPLPARSVDTGMGFERILSVLQGKRSNYDTDLFEPIFDYISEFTGKKYGSGEQRVDVAMRVCADHVRAVTAAIADGALPSNTGRGYVVRRLIRRAARFARKDLDYSEPLLWKLVQMVTYRLGKVFPEMEEQKEHVRRVIKVEEESFARTLDRGLLRFEELRTNVRQNKSTVIDGAAAYDLYATYGFPRDLVELMAREEKLTVDENGWNKAEAAHQDASRSEGKFKQLLSAEQLESLAPTKSTYHDPEERNWRLETECLLLTANNKDQQDGRLVLAETPFYPEGGGQVGDTGVIAQPGGMWRFHVTDTKRIGGVVVHLGMQEGYVERSSTRVIATVDRARRDRTRKNHTATHLLHKALKEVLGAHVGQQGSYVGPDRLRFDFSHPKAVTPEELERIEAIVNEKIYANPSVTTTIEDLDAAKARGVVAMFGEKYDQKVRVLDVGGWSLELCGGTHVRAAGDIGPFVIVSERAIQAGVRRIEALTGPAAVEEIQRQRRILRDAAQSLKTVPEEIAQRIDVLQAQLKEAKQKSSAGSATDVAGCLARLRESLQETKGVAWGAFAFPELDQKNLRDLVDRARSIAPKMAFSVLGREAERVPHIHVVLDVPAGARLAAGELAKIAVQVLGGGGGGKPDLAQGQGLKPDAIDSAVEKLRAAIQAALSTL
jgi:alanyl-tRNA synthetase